ncbi:MAG: TonB-dependent receptor [Bacteroidales bacterium]|nr:TonB-dependent receptor [Candidatus Cryptobacteroides aphodequi]
MKKLFTILFTLCLATQLVASAQGIRVTGKVVFQEDDSPAAGAYVIIKDSNEHAAVGSDGTYSITCPSTESILVYSFVGYSPVEEKVGSRKVINVSLAMDGSNVLNEVVTIGYSGVKRSDLTGSVVSVSSKDIESTAMSTVSEALQGKMAGVMVTTADGDVDADVSFRIRGGTSINNSNEPLYLVDGFPVQNINDISPSDIKSIDILKDAAATAIYGAQGANGVVLVTTKTAYDTKATVKFNSYVQANALARKMDVMDVYEYILWNYEMDKLSSRNGALKKFGYPDDFYIYKKYGKGTDWQEKTFGRTTMAQYYNVSIAGGSTGLNYLASATHSNREGIQVGTGIKRTNLSFKLNHTISPSVKMQYNLMYTNTANEGISVGTIAALQYAPTTGVSAFRWSPDDFANEEETAFEEYEMDEYFEGVAEDSNRLYQRQLQMQRDLKTDVIRGNVSLNWKINDHFTFNTSNRATKYYTRNHLFYGPLTALSTRTYGGKPTVILTDNDTDQYMTTNTLNYSLTKGSSNLSLLLGQEYLVTNSYQSSHTYSEFEDEISMDAAFANLALGKNMTQSSKMSGDEKLLSFFSRANYSLKNRYIFTFTMRADGSTKFAPGHQWGYFPAGAFAWRISQEQFMRRVRAVSDLKLRLSYGTVGNNRIGDELYQMTYSVLSNSYNPEVRGEVLSSYVPASAYLVNPNLKWETTISRNVGIDYSLFKHKVWGAFEVYGNTTKDLLIASEVPAYTGYTSVYANVGQTTNKGVEFTINASVIRKYRCKLDLMFNIAHNNNTIDHLASGEDYWFKNSSWSNYQREFTDFYINVGGQVGQFYGYVADGMYSVDDFDYIDGSYVLKEGVADDRNILNVTELLPGMLKLKKLSGEGNIVNADEDRRIIGCNVPKAQGGFGLDFSWKNFDANVMFNYMIGFDTFNATKVAMTSLGVFGYRNLFTTSDSSHRFRYFDDEGNSLLTDPEALKEFNKNADIWSPNMYSYVVSDWAVEDASFVRLTNLTVGYTLPATVSHRIHIDKLRVYLTGNNLFCLTKYSGFDPEINVQKGLTPGIDYKGYPRSRSVTAGINLTF